MDLGLEGRRALVGGGASGIGGGIATALAGEGARVALVGRTAARVEAEAAKLDALAVVADLATPDGPAGAVEAAVGALGGLDLLVVNTGGPPGGTFDTLSEADWEQAIAGTLQSMLRLIRAALPHLREGVDPSILIVLSSSVREPIPALTTSNVLRPGLAGLVKSLTAEIAPVRINGLAPGRIATDRIATLDSKRAEAAGTTVEEIARRTKATIPLGPLRRRRGDRARGGVPAVARRVVRDRRDRPGRRRDDPRPALATRPRRPHRGNRRRPRPRREVPVQPGAAQQVVQVGDGARVGRHAGRADGRVGDRARAAGTRSLRMARFRIGWFSNRMSVA